MADTKAERTGIDAYFFRLIATFEAAAMQQLGKIAHPVTGDVEVRLEGARDSIEMLDMMRRKTDGNLNDDERQLLDHVLYQLRMNYVEVSREGEAGEAEDSDEASVEAAGEDGGEASGDAAGDDTEEAPGDTMGEDEDE